ncbi:probable transmembrane ascorbate ferrireductase 3 [Quercus suber]|uniref:probable transmembrane ascorbate ferrireductase 3 n=1 Tax=Quercus suber TaxID=58331 RepID=UPI000CE1A06C|nr:probable transmembrane ascorbate ferrireductase 3 [Quercus suber]POE59922.1 putative transmembrane ascorbate ferrireductase 3 [Quercus suber]
MDRRSEYYSAASRLTYVAHFFGLTALILILIWLLHYRGGLNYESNNPDLVFNVHPFLMFFSLIFLGGEAMMAYKTVRATHGVRKSVHMLVHLLAIVLAIVGISAAFKYHDMIYKEDVYSLHSWIGITTICMFCLQWVFGFFTFMFPRASVPTRNKFLPWHLCGGRALLYMAICAALTGLLEKSTFLQLSPHQHESRLLNFTGLAILFFGIFVDLSVALGYYTFYSGY